MIEEQSEQQLYPDIDERAHRPNLQREASHHQESDNEDSEYMAHQDADGDDDNAADDDDEVVENEDESEANSSHTGSLIEDDDELADMRALVRQQGPITRRMAKNSLQSVNNEIKLIKITIIVLFFCVLFATLVASPSIEIPSIDLGFGDDELDESIEQDESKCWTQFKDEKCSIDKLQTPLCKKLYECSFRQPQKSIFGQSQKTTSSIDTIIWMLVIMGIACVISYYFPEQRHRIIEQLLRRMRLMR